MPNAPESLESDSIHTTRIERLVIRSQIRQVVSEPVKDMDEDRLKLRQEILHDLGDKHVESLDRSEKELRRRIKRLSPKDRKILKAAYDFGVFGSDAAQKPTQGQICKRAGCELTSKGDPDAYAHKSLARLVDMGFLGNLADYGRRGGYWVTEEGRLAIETPIPRHVLHGFGDVIPR